MKAMPAFLWNKRGVLVSHRGSLGREILRSRVERARLACWFESLAVAPRPLQRRRAETIFFKTQSKQGSVLLRKVRDRGTRWPAHKTRCATRAFARSEDEPCSILHRRARRGNRDSDRLVR